MRILAISGSLRASSTNTLLVLAIARLAPSHMEMTLYEGLADLPHFTPDLDGDDPPASVRSLRQLLQAADGVLSVRRNTPLESLEHSRTLSTGPCPQASFGANR